MISLKESSIKKKWVDENNSIKKRKFNSFKGLILIFCYIIAISLLAIVYKEYPYNEISFWYVHNIIDQDILIFCYIIVLLCCKFLIFGLV